MKIESSASLVGVGLRAPHLQEISMDNRGIGWFEVHSENYFNAYSAASKYLNDIREKTPISLHGVGLSLGSTDNKDRDQHLRRLKELMQRIDPCFISEHLSWNAINGVHIPDLLPIPYTLESFDVFASNISIVQDYLQQKILIENPSSYVEYKASMEHEADFLVRLAEKTGARILLDINNVFVSSHNHGWDPEDYIRAIPPSLVAEMHLAGHSECILPSGKKLLIDTHDRSISDAVWQLYHKALLRFGQIPTLIEWDDAIPELNILLEEARKAESYLLSSVVEGVEIKYA